jgi:hypothetical protein
MTLMTMPGFAAEASIGSKSGRYRITRIADAAANEQKIVPQRFPICDLEDDGCMQECLARGGRPGACLVTCCEIWS